MNGTEKREAAAAVAPCFELNLAAYSGNPQAPGGVSAEQLRKARLIIRGGVGVVEAVHGGDTAAKDAGSAFVGSQLGAKLRSGEWTPDALNGMTDEMCTQAGQGLGQVAAEYITRIKSGS